jgi:uncharacterized protein (DUF2141 family)
MAKLTINAVEQKKNKQGKVYYAVETSYGKFSSSEDIRPYIGKTAEFETATKDDYSYINRPLPDIPKDSVSQVSTPNGDKYLSTKSMLMSYSKDFAVAFAPILSTADAKTLLEDVYKKMVELVGIGEDPEIPF